jgi:dTMP kinase
VSLPGQRAVFVAIDGPNGVGKTSTIGALVERLRAEGRPVTAVRQPSDSVLGAFIRDAETHYVGLSLAALVVADRIHLTDTVIRPALARGDTVITDRHIASTLALQQIDGIDLDLLWELNAHVLAPDLSVFLFAPPAVLEARLNRRGRSSRFEHTQDISAVESRYFDAAETLLRSKGVRTLNVSTADRSLDEVVSSIERAIGDG